MVVAAFCATASNYTLKLLVRCCYDGEGKRVHSCYADIAEAAFGRRGRLVTQLFETASLFGVSTLFLILAGKFLEEIFEGVEYLDLSTRNWIVVCSAVLALPLILLSTVREMRLVAIMGVVVVVVVVVTTISVSLSTNGNGSSSNNDDRGDHALVLAQGLPQAFAAMTLAFSAHAGRYHPTSTSRYRVI